MQPREWVMRMEANAQLPGGDDERFNGYGVMGLPFRTGHVLAMRRFGASSVGPMEPLAGSLLGVGRVGLQGRVPNGQRFVVNPRRLWTIVESRAVLAGEDLGPPGPVEPQARLGDFWVPQRGTLALGRAFFEPFDAARHSSRTSDREAH